MPTLQVAALSWRVASVWPAVTMTKRIRQCGKQWYRRRGGVAATAGVAVA